MDRTLNRQLAVAQNPQTKRASSIHCLFYYRNKINKKRKYNNSKIIMILANAGDLDTHRTFSSPYKNGIMEDAALLGGGGNIPKIGEARYSDENPGIGFTYNNYAISNTNSGIA